MFVFSWETVWSELKRLPRWQMPEYEAHERLPAERSAILKGAVAVTVFAVIVAAMEINIEGQYGWAERLPCWRPRPDAWYAQIWLAVMGGKPMDGYHLAAFTMWNTIFFVPYFFGARFTWRSVFQVFVWSHLFAIFEDFQWFVWNPAYGLAKFDAAHIWWHKSWIGPVPVDYPMMVGRALLCSLLAPFGLKGGLQAVVLLLASTGFLVFVSWATTP